jgi:hypothetical protein
LKCFFKINEKVFKEIFKVNQIKMSAVNNLSVFVPHVFPNFDQKYVAEAFSAIGEVNRVDFVSKLDRDGKPFNSVYVHFNKWWDDCSHSKYIQSEIEEKGSAQFYHDDSKYYWIVLPNKSKKHNPDVPKHKIDIGDDKAINSKVVQNDQVVVPSTPFDPEEWDAQASEEAAQMAEIEDELVAEDANLVSIDKRYLKLVEEENLSMRCELTILRQAIANLDMMYRAEAAKVIAFSSNM